MPKPKFELTERELDLCRQWFDSVQDVNPSFLQEADYRLAAHIYSELGFRVPNSIKEKLLN